MPILFVLTLLLYQLWAYCIAVDTTAKNKKQKEGILSRGAAQLLRANGLLPEQQ